MSAAGWLLSAVHQLNAFGYLCVVVGFAVSFFWWQKTHGFSGINPSKLLRMARRFRRPLPFGFLALAFVALIGGILYSPTNYDALAYRVPRVLHWLAHGEWHWVHTEFNRLNVRAPGQE